MSTRTRCRSKRNRPKNGRRRPRERMTASPPSASEFNMERLAAQSRSELALNAALIDARLTWAADWRNGGKKFTRHTDGGPLQ